MIAFCMITIRGQNAFAQIVAFLEPLPVWWHLSIEMKIARIGRLLCTAFTSLLSKKTVPDCPKHSVSTLTLKRRSNCGSLGKRRISHQTLMILEMTKFVFTCFFEDGNIRQSIQSVPTIIHIITVGLIQCVTGFNKLSVERDSKAIGVCIGQRRFRVGFHGKRSPQIQQNSYMVVFFWGSTIVYDRQVHRGILAWTRRSPHPTRIPSGSAYSTL